MDLQTLVTNLAPIIRYDELEGRECIVAPMVMITEGVHNGNNGPLYYPSEQISHPASVANWNTKPVVVYHPEINGQGVSACSAEILNSRKVGVVMNAEWDDPKLRAEAWLYLDRLEEVDDRIIEALENNQMMEVSTGVFTDNEKKEGVWNGEKYIGIATNMRADHLAILPDKVGACSIKDGAGLLQVNARQVVNRLKNSGVLTCNALSHSDIRSALFGETRERFGDDVWIVDVFDDHFIYERLDKLFSLDYTSNEDNLTLAEGPPQEVRRKTEFEPVTDNEEGESMPKTKTKPDKEKEKIVNGLIDNEKTKWEEGDKEFLLTLEDDQLVKFEPVEVEPEDSPNDPQPSEGTARHGDPSPEQNKEKEKDDKEVTVNEYVQNAPPEIQDMLKEGLATRSEQKKNLVANILKNEKNRFTEDQLNAKPLGEIQAIAELCGNEEETTDPGHPQFQFNYAGVAGSAVNNSEPEEIKPLGLPAMNWEDE